MEQIKKISSLATCSFINSSKGIISIAGIQHLDRQKCCPKTVFNADADKTGHFKKEKKKNCIGG